MHGPKYRPGALAAQRRVTRITGFGGVLLPASERLFGVLALQPPRDLAVSLEALPVAQRVVEHDPRGDAVVFLSQRVGQPVPRRLGGEPRDVLVGDLRDHAFDVAGLLLL